MMSSEVAESACSHSRLEPCERVRAAEIIGAAELSAKQLYLQSKSIRRCLDCREIVLSPSLRRDVDLAAEAFIALARTMRPNAETTVRMGAEPATASTDTTETPRFDLRQPRFRLADVVLSAPTRLEVDEALARVRHHALIYDTWGFRAVDPVADGVTINLMGPPGVGKSRTAEAMAGELGRAFLQLTAGDIESRFMGQTPRNLKAAFQAAAEAGAVLFFDEADSLFGKRASDVTQGVDHEVNVTKSALLVEVERFPGVMIIATNFPQNFDRAFLRRLTHNVRVRLPDHDARRRLWDLHVPVGVPLEEARDAFLEEISVLSEGLSGGDILTAMRLALPAVALARGAEGPMTLADVKLAVDRIRAARRDIGRETNAGSTAAAMRALIGGSLPVADPPAAPSAPPADATVATADNAQIPKETNGG
jgi:hypothetical protein